jgi:hypothetical protein
VSEPQEPDWLEPGVDRHAWESEFESLLPDLEDDPEGTLPQLAELVGRMLESMGFAPELGGATDESEHERAFRAANDLAERSRAGEDLPPGDVAFAVDQLIEVYESLLRNTRST